MLKNLIQRLLKRFRGAKVIWRDKRGEIQHQYVFKKEKNRHGLVRAQCTIYGSGQTVISYYLPQYRGNADAIHLALVEDTLHELTHWAHRDDYSDDPDHCNRWREILYPEIEYVTDWQIEYTE